MKHPGIIVADIGPGNESDITPAVVSTLQESDGRLCFSQLKINEPWTF